MVGYVIKLFLQENTLSEGSEFLGTAGFYFDDFFNVNRVLRGRLSVEYGGLRSLNRLHIDDITTYGGGSNRRLRTIDECLGLTSGCSC
jgi:hypothetical protein